VPCARLHTRQLLWEWQLTDLSDSAELLVSEIVTNAIQVSRADAQTALVRFWLLADRARLLILVWDASPLPPVRMSTSDDAENGRGLLQKRDGRRASVTHVSAGCLPRVGPCQPVFAPAAWPDYARQTGRQA
jgi:hypothetical protein